MPFVKDRKHLLDFMKDLQKATCAYEGRFCDCKYGAKPLEPGYQGEANGCPELRMAVMLLEGMTEAEFERAICSMGGIRV